MRMRNRLENRQHSDGLLLLPTYICVLKRELQKWKQLDVIMNIILIKCLNIRFPSVLRLFTQPANYSL